MESESSESEAYYSDAIDPEIEVSLYGALHHHLDQHSNDQQFNHHLNDNKSSEESIRNCVENKSPFNASERQDIRPKVWSELKNVNNNSFIRNNNKIECIQIDDSSGDSDVIIISDNEKNKRKKCFKSKDDKKNTSHKKSKTKSKSSTKYDITFANVDNLKDSSILAMNKFYNEDIHDSDEETETFNNMSNDEKLWKINYNDILLCNRKSNRYYRNRFICNNCSERGHQARDCPLPKKSPTCYLCGLSGHRSERCKSILCSKCFSKNHRTAKCNVLVNQLVCDVCGVRGHDANQCTHNWRKYHMTTTAEVEPLFCNLATNRRVSCYNCGAFGKHFAHECRSKTVNHFLHFTPPSPLMDLPKKGHSFNERSLNRSHHSIYNGSISSNELGSCSASFDNTLSEFDLSQNSLTSTSYNRGNKHIKWIYPETNSITILGNNQKDEVLEEKRIFNDSSDCTPIFHNEMPLLFNSAHTHTREQINNSMLERSQTTPKRSKRKNRHKTNVQRHQLLAETNISSNEIKRKLKQKKIRRRINRKLNKKLSNIHKRDNT